MAWAYRGYTGDSKGEVSPSIQSLQRWLHEQDPDGKSLGAYANRPVRGGVTPSVHRTGRALDWAFGSREAGDRIIGTLTGRASPYKPLQLVIWQRRQWGGRRGPGWRPYGGTDPHTGHAHFETSIWA